MQAVKYLVRIILLLLTQTLSAQVAVAVDKMNALYAGLINPLTIAISDIPDSNLLLIPSFGSISRTDTGHYAWSICQRDTSIATLQIQDVSADTLVAVVPFRVKKTPVPVPVLARQNRSSVLGNGEYKSSGGIALILQNFDFEVKCDILYFEVEYLPKDADVVTKRNLGARWSSGVNELINIAKPGDAYIFYNIAYRCGCDPTVNVMEEGLSFRIR